MTHTHAKPAGYTATGSKQASASAADSMTNLCIPVHHLILLDHLAAYLAAMIHNGIHLSPCTELSLPVSDSGEWGNDEEGTPKTHQVNLRQECNGLNCLPQTHFIRQNAVLPVEIP